jgi:hypothetical protein
MLSNLSHGAAAGVPAAFVAAGAQVSGVSANQRQIVAQGHDSVSPEFSNRRARTLAMTDKAYGLARTSREKPL